MNLKLKILKYFKVVNFGNSKSQRLLHFFNPMEGLK